MEPPELRDARASARALTQELSARATERTRELTVANIDFSRETALRLEAEEALRGSEERLQCYFGLRLVGLAMLEFGPKRLEVNDRMCEMLGYSREELQGLNWAKLTHPDDLDAEMRSYAQLVSGEKSHFLQRKRWVGKNGNLVHSKISAKCKRHDNGAIEYVAVMVEEVTERAKEGSSGDSSPLSLREKEVARLIGLGQTVKEIATALGLSEKTVSTYRKRILDKLNLTTTAEIIRHVIRREP